MTDLVYLFTWNDPPKGTRQQPFLDMDICMHYLAGGMWSTASWRKAAFYKLLRRSENVILKIVYALKNLFWSVKYLL